MYTARVDGYTLLDGGLQGLGLPSSLPRKEGILQKEEPLGLLYPGFKPVLEGFDRFVSF